MPGARRDGGTDVRVYMRLHETNGTAAARLRAGRVPSKAATENIDTEITVINPREGLAPRILTFWQTTARAKRAAVAETRRGRRRRTCPLAAAVYIRFSSNSRLPSSSRFKYTKYKIKSETRFSPKGLCNTFKTQNRKLRFKRSK